MILGQKSGHFRSSRDPGIPGSIPVSHIVYRTDPINDEGLRYKWVISKRAFSIKMTHFWTPFFEATR